MKPARYSQLKELGLNRTDLDFWLRNLNDSILKDIIWKKEFKEYLTNEMIENDLSIHVLDVLRFKLLKTVGLKLNTETSIYATLYNLIMENILLPDYVKWWNKEDKFKELDNIIERVEVKIDKLLENMNNGSFNISLWNKDSIINELDWSEWNFHNLEYRTFDLWGIFWVMHIWFNEELKKFIFQIPVRLKNLKVKVWEEGLVKNIDSKSIEEVVQSITFSWNSASTKKVNIKWLEDFKIILSKKTNKDCRFWVDDFSNYYTLTIDNSKILSDLNTENYSSDEIISFLEWYLELVNLLINKLVVKSDIEHKKKFFTFSTFSPYYEEDDNDDSSLSKSTIDKFSKMLISDKNPIYLSDVWGQKEAKEEILKIIKSIKHEEIMRSWWAKTINWMVFEWPPGTWKTLLAKVVATEVSADVYNIKLTDIASSAFINEWANNVKELFKFLRQKAKKSKKKIIVILDELDALFKKREWKNQSAEDTKIVNTFLTEMSWFDDVSNIIFIWTTNNLKALDPAVIRSWRMSLTIKVDKPDEKARKQIFDIHIWKACKTSKKAEKAFSKIDVSKFLKISKWLSWADIEEIIREIIEAKALEEVETWKITKIKSSEIIKFIKKMKKNINEDWDEWKTVKWFRA